MYTETDPSGQHCLPERSPPCGPAACPRARAAVRRPDGRRPSPASPRRDPRLAVGRRVYPFQWAVQAPVAAWTAMRDSFADRSRARGRQHPSSPPTTWCCGCKLMRFEALEQENRRLRGAARELVRASCSARWSPRSSASTSTRSGSACWSTRAAATACSAARRRSTRTASSARSRASDRSRPRSS